MAHPMTTSVAHQLGALFEGGSAVGLSDRQLIDRFVNGRDSLAAEGAFSALVARHGPMVLGVCQQLLGDRHDAEDAFQAVFFVLARRARSVRDPDLLSHWLYGVALRTARKARTQLGRLRRREENAAANRAEAYPDAPADRAVFEGERAEVLHEEIDRLPASARLPVVLCYFEGLSLAEAAQRLRCPAGTVHSRLVRAREKLRSGLIRRGVVLSTSAMAAALAPRSASASIPPLLCDSTTRAAIAFAARHTAVGGAVAAPAAALAQEVFRTMLFHKLKLVATAVLALAVMATGAGVLLPSFSATARSREGEPPGEPRAPEARQEPRPPDSPRPPEAVTGDPHSTRMTVAGRVLDADGKPVRGAVVDLVTRARSPRVAASDEGDRHDVLGQAQADADGRFQLDAPRTGSSRVFEVHAVAAAPGYGLGWVELNPDAEKPVAEIRLQPEQPVRVRLVDVTGSPARGVEVAVVGVAIRDDKGEYHGVPMGTHPPRGVHIWPRPARTDDGGRVTFSGIGRGSAVSLGVSDLRYVRQSVAVDPARIPATGETTIALQPSRLIEGRVLDADTGQPIPNTVVSASGLVMNEHARGIFQSKFRADDQGRFAMNPAICDDYTLTAFPTGGEPYLSGEVDLKWTKGTVKATRDIKLRRGALIHGKVTEAGTGRPLPASSVMFMPVRGGGKVVSGWHATVASQDDGTFQVTVPPGKGHLLIFGPSGDYVLGEISYNKLEYDRPGGPRYHGHAIVPYAVKAGDPPLDVAATLKRGVTIKGRVEGPGGETITDGFVLTTLRIEPFSPSWRGDFHVPIRDGRFELHGLDPEGSTRIHVLDPGHEWGATVDVSGKQAGEDLTIRLEPCGQAKARFVGPDGKPVARHHPMFEIIVTPGPSGSMMVNPDQAELSADAEMLANVDRKHYGTMPRTDVEGRITLISLIPGALYRITDLSSDNDQDSRKLIHKDFTVKPGETLDLGNIVIQKPTN